MTIAELISELNVDKFDVPNFNRLADFLKNLINSSVRPYKVYTALMSQNGTNAPTVEILENSLGNIVWSYFGTPGLYVGTLNGAFVVGKTMCSGLYSLPVNPMEVNIGTTVNILDSNSIILASGELETGVPPNIVGNLKNDLLNKTPIEIRVYN